MDLFGRDWLWPTLCASIDTRRGLLVAVPLDANTVAISVSTLRARLALLGQERTGVELFQTLARIPGATKPKSPLEWECITRVFTDFDDGVVLVPIDAFSFLVQRTVEEQTRLDAIVNRLDGDEDPYASLWSTPTDEGLMLQTILPAFRRWCQSDDAKFDIGPGFQPVTWVFYRTMESKCALATPPTLCLSPTTPRMDEFWLSCASPSPRPLSVNH